MEVPEGRAAPLAASLAMRSGAAPVTADLDFLQTGPQTWDIEVDTDAGLLLLALGGSKLRIGEGPLHEAPDREYPRLYARFADLIERDASDVDLTPLRLVADAFLIGERVASPPFEFEP